ncbi:MAG: ParA family protein [Acutalibacteraceae bacterium]|jgi:chromosome partitioning protein|nr:ParA family protein [Acutalibacteraceae bacterium]
MGKVIAIANHKGGVGKTTSVAAIGAILSEMGKRVLLIDLDAQANLTSSLLREEQESTIYRALRGDEALPVVKAKENLYLVPSSLELAGIELELSGRMSREFIIKELIEPVLPEYDYILLDCPPSLGLITINALTASQYLYIPLTAEALPSKGLTMLLDIMGMVQKRLNKDIALGGIIITRWEKSNLSLMVEEMLRATYGEIVFTTKIRKNVSVAEAPLHSKDILAYAPQSNGAKDYRALVAEIIERVK